MSADDSRRKRAARRAAASLSTLSVMGIVGLLAVGMTTPIAAVAAGQTSLVSEPQETQAPSKTVDDDEIQAYVTAADSAEYDINRDQNYQTTTLAELAAESGITHTSNTFVNDPNAAIQWPFAVGVPISSGFGQRWGRMHEGVDFTPGQGAPVQAIADGTVRIASENGGAYGVHVMIDHVIDGQRITSHYAHMLYGSLKVVPGQQVTVGTVIGNTGNTGRSYGAHTHFEILVDGTTAIDPIPWLRKYAGG